MTAKTVLQRVAREPAAYFFAAGGLVFALAPQPTSMSPAVPSGRDDHVAADVDRERVIRITDAVREHLRKGLLELNAVEPSGEDMESAIDQWIDTEILYREGLALGLDQEDPVVRLRVATKMRYFLQRQAVADPEDAELLAFFRANAQRYLVEPRVDFEHIFVPGSDDESLARARQLLELVRGGASPRGLGERFPRGRSFRRRRRGEIEPGFGAPFAAAMFRAPVGEWGTSRSDHGWHVVRVNRRSGNAEPGLEDVRSRVAIEWRLEAVNTGETAAIEQFRNRYEIVGRDR